MHGAKKRTAEEQPCTESQGVPSARWKVRSSRLSGLHNTGIKSGKWKTTVYRSDDAENILADVETEVIQASGSGASFKLMTGAGEGAGYEKKILFRPLTKAEFESFRQESKEDELHVMKKDRVDTFRKKPQKRSKEKKEEEDEKKIKNGLQIIPKASD